MYRDKAARRGHGALSNPPTPSEFMSTDLFDAAVPVRPNARASRTLAQHTIDGLRSAVAEHFHLALSSTEVADFLAYRTAIFSPSSRSRARDAVVRWSAAVALIIFSSCDLLSHLRLYGVLDDPRSIGFACRPRSLCRVPDLFRSHLVPHRFSSGPNLQRQKSKIMRGRYDDLVERRLKYIQRQIALDKSAVNA